MVRWRAENAYLKVFRQIFAFLVLSLSLPITNGVTNSQDVYAINNLYAALGSPAIPGWVASGGDPCGEGWQGVQCAGPNMTAIILNAANLGGQLGDALGNFTTLITMDLSNNHIGGIIPENLPPHLQRFFLSANQFIGNLPGGIGELSLLTDMSLNNNLLMGPIADVFQTLVGLINLDLSSNNLSGQLPASFGNLSALTTLHLQNNQLTGTLNVLEDLRLQDLNIENNLFSGPVPPQMLTNIPNFRKDGNPFNVTPVASPPGSLPSQPPPSQVSSGLPEGQLKNASATVNANRSSGRGFFTTARIIGLVVALFIAIGIVILIIFMCTSWSRGRHTAANRVERNEIVAYGESEKNHQKNENLMRPSSDVVKVSNQAVETRTMNHKINMAGLDANLAPPTAHVAAHDNEAVLLEVVSESEKQNHLASVIPPTTNVVSQQLSKSKPRKPLRPVSDVVSYTISDLQQFTNSFGQDNFIGEGSLGSVYFAEIPDGKMLAVKKLDTVNPSLHTTEAFLKLVSSISKLHHENITKLIGYSAEHDQRILIYEYCGNGTLHDALHSTDRDNKVLSWKSRVKLARGAAQALEYLHEVCQPPVVHRNFKSSNILLDDDFSAKLSDCGLGSLYSSSCASQVSAHVVGSFSYGAPEYTMSGIYNIHSDVYSFGVVMLELLTGRKPLDRTRPRAEHSLVRWATPQLHDIDALSRMVDPALEGAYSVKSLSRFADIISLCLQPEPEFRPPMSEIVQSLLHA
ncbi:STRUBBELIG-RECEPTOR FAMILY 3 protein [Nymphaea thermarum]|nr:STRUBBELIG-RECEPTOR FAMILY 3 protein [Nymphaea thermarum]